MLRWWGHGIRMRWSGVRMIVMGHNAVRWVRGVMIHGWEHRVGHFLWLWARLLGVWGWARGVLDEAFVGLICRLSD